jgi:hypothetical protein
MFYRAVMRLEHECLGWYVIAVLGYPGEKAGAIRVPLDCSATGVEFCGAETWQLNLVD